MSKSNMERLNVAMERLDALREAVPYLLKALNVQAADNAFIIAGIRDSGENTDKLPSILVINTSENKTLALECKIVADIDPDDLFRTSFIRCKSKPREEYIHVKLETQDK